MEPQDFTQAVDFCKLVDSADLFEYLGLPVGCTADESLASLAERRKHMQAMQANPKFKDSAKALIKSYAAFQRILAEPGAYREAVARQAELARLPMLELAIDSVMADGSVTANEEEFVRRAALQLGISMETYERVFRERAQQRGIVVGGALPPGPPAPPAWAGGKTAAAAQVPQDITEPKPSGAAGVSWWDATFTRMLLEAIPGGPGDMVDIYCRTALSALTIIPARKQLTYVGVDRSAERLEQARSQLPTGEGRLALVQGEPHALPIPDASVDYVLAIRALANQRDTVPIFAEAFRVLRPGGRMIVAEPDGLAETFYFDGHLTAYNEAFHHLLETVDDRMGEDSDAAGRPGLAIGPKLHERMIRAGLRPTSLVIHGSNTLKARTFGSLAKRLRAYPEQLARSVGVEGTAELYAVMSAVADLEKATPSERAGLGGQFLPIFLAVGTKD